MITSQARLASQDCRSRRSRCICAGRPRDTCRAMPSTAYPSLRDTESEAALSVKAPDVAYSAPSPSKASARTAARIAVPMPLPWYGMPIQDPVPTSRSTAKSVALRPCIPTTVPSRTVTRFSSHRLGVQDAQLPQWYCIVDRARAEGSSSVHATPNGWTAGS